eukprot:Hpha_TRINITY_DN15659_c3_g5::TRINITY_DN15659_c3_g5_i1::g.101357::m.101357
MFWAKEIRASVPGAPRKCLSSVYLFCTAFPAHVAYCSVQGGDGQIPSDSSGLTRSGTKRSPLPVDLPPWRVSNGLDVGDACGLPGTDNAFEEELGFKRKALGTLLATVWLRPLAATTGDTTLAARGFPSESPDVDSED